MRTKRRTWSIASVWLLLCTLLCLLGGVTLRVHAADIETLTLGAEVRGTAVYAEALAVGTVRFSAEMRVAEGESVSLGLMRNADAVPTQQDNARGLIFSVTEKDGDLYLDVKGVELRAVTQYVQGYRLEGTRLSVELARRTRGYRLTVNGVRMISDYADTLSALTAATFSLANKTYFAAATFGADATVIVESLWSDAQSDSVTGNEWFSASACTLSGSTAAVTVRDTAMRLGTSQNVSYVRIGLRLAEGEGEETYLAFASSEAPPLFTAQGDPAGNGVALKFRNNNGNVYLDVTLYSGSTQVRLCGNLLLGKETDVSVELKKKPSLLGYALLLNGTRLTIEDTDILGGLTKEELGQYVDASFSGTFVSVGSSGDAAVREVTSMAYDPQPILNEKNIVNASDYGTKTTDWEGEYRIENGVLLSHSYAYLRQGLDTRYVGFDLGFAALSDSATTLDSYIAFGLSSVPSATAVLPEANSAGNAIFFLVSKRNGTVYLSGYSRFQGELRNFLSATALQGVQAENEMKVEFVYCDYDLTLYINGTAVKTSYGSNPLDDYYSLYYENEAYQTHLCFASYAYADAQKPTLTAQNCAQYRVYGIENDLPAAYIPSSAEVTKSETLQKERFRAAKAIVPCVITFALCAAAGSAVVVVFMKKKEKGK